MHDLIIACSISFVSIIVFSLKPGSSVPIHLSCKFSSKSKFAKTINKLWRSPIIFRDYSISIFHEVAIYVNFVNFLLSLILFCIDLSTNNAVYLFLGKKTLTIICLVIICLPMIYCSIFAVWWDCSKRRYKKSNEE